jgi:putative nucleotidyltransferase with HDIG domain
MTPQEYVVSVKNLPSISSVGAKVDELLNSPTSNADDFDAVISQDPALTAKLLKMVNSAFYGLNYKVESISRAVTIVGFKQIRELVTTMAVLDAFDGYENDLLDLKKFWEHSLSCGVAGRVFAILARVPNPDVYFTAGLLHDVGKLIFLSHSPSEYKEVLHLNESKQILSHESEKEVFGFTHCEVGAELCRLWNHPEPLLEIVAHHHSPDTAPNGNRLVPMIHLSDCLANAFQIGDSGNRFVPPLNTSAWEKTGLKVSTLKPAVGKIFEMMDEIKTAILK